MDEKWDHPTNTNKVNSNLLMLSRRTEVGKHIGGVQSTETLRQERVLLRRWGVGAGDGGGGAHQEHAAFIHGGKLEKVRRQACYQFVKEEESE